MKYDAYGTDPCILTCFQISGNGCVVSLDGDRSPRTGASGLQNAPGALFDAQMCTQINNLVILDISTTTLDAISSKSGAST